MGGTYDLGPYRVPLMFGKLWGGKVQVSLRSTHTYEASEVSPQVPSRIGRG